MSQTPYGVSREIWSFTKSFKVIIVSDFSQMFPFALESFVFQGSWLVCVHSQSHVSVCIEQSGGRCLLKAKLWQPFCCWGRVLNLTIERESQWSEPVWATELKREREGAEGRGRRGIRLGDKAAGTCCLAGSRSYCELVLLKSLQRKRELDKIFIISPSSELIWIYFIFLNTDRKKTCWTLISFPILWFCICYGAGVGMVVSLRKSLHSLLSVFKKKGECWLTWRNLAGFDFRLLTDTCLYNVNTRLLQLSWHIPIRYIPLSGRVALWML